MFKNASHTISQVPVVEPVVLQEPPKVIISPNGIVGTERVAIQVAITQQRGKVSGANPNTMGGKAHRLEITRMCAYDGMTDNQFSWLQTRLGKANEDRVLRPNTRHSLVMYRSGPRGCKDLKSWFAMYKEVQDAITWCQTQVVASRGQDQLALVALVDVDKWQLTTPQNSAFGNFYEGVITSIFDLEIVRLSAAPELDGFTVDSEDGDPVDYIETEKPSLVKISSIVED